MSESQKHLSAHFFLSNLSHEIRTPLNGIVGYNQLLQQTKLNPSQKMYLNSMNQCSIQLMELVNDILDFSKLAIGKMQIHNSCFRLREIIDDVTSTIGYRISEKRQRCRYIIDENLPEYIISDKQKLIQVMINILSNANKFTDIDGRILVGISKGKENTLDFYVEDTGIGITEKDQQKLFNAFYQVEQSVTKTGSGLGLAISKQLVELLGGSIRVESQPGQGSTFFFSVKYEPYDNFQKQVLRNSKLLSKKYVLVVDDNVDNRLIMNEMLFEAKMSPVVCSSAKEALRMVEKKRYPFAVGLLDICMPDMPGTDLAKKIKNIDPEFPLIALSSLDEPFNNMNFEFVLTKPVNKLKLLDSLTQVIKRNDITDCELNKPDMEISGKKVRKIDGIDLKSARILLAEDVSYNREVIGQMLRSCGYMDIDYAVDGEDALKKIAEKEQDCKPYDILLLDLKMPKMDGFSVAKNLQGKSLPKIAVLTASVLEQDRERCKKLGVKYFVLKPVNMAHLKAVLKYLSTDALTL